MPPKKHSTIWDAHPHTIAKIAILESYLQAWFAILGRTARGNDLTYIDGFAGPGTYTNFATGSPIAALRSAAKAVESAGSSWVAGCVNCVFIESDRERFVHLSDYIEPFRSNPRLNVRLLNSTFVEGIEATMDALPSAFSDNAPLFVFIDPFGAKGVPFSAVAELLGSARSEILFNFDVDAVGRILKAGSRSDHEKILNTIYGDDSWRAVDFQKGSFRDLCLRLLDLYKDKLRTIPGVGYVFSFEMSKTHASLHYFLVFASRHVRGLQKMKEAMQRIDQDGEYRFLDARVNRPMLFRFDSPSDFAPRMYKQFRGQSASYAELLDFALNETPFVNPKKMLANLESRGLVSVVSSNPKRRRGTFEEKSTKLVIFEGGEPDG